jgi:hypothetical protein
VYSCRDGDYVAFPCPRPTTLALGGPARGTATDTVELPATLSSLGVRLPGRTVNLRVGSLTATAVTDSAGVALLRLPLDVDAGDYVAQATFSGDDNYSAAAAESPIGVDRDPSLLAYTGQTQGTGSSVRVSGTLTDDDPTPLGGRTVGIAIGTVATSATTDGSGRFSATVEVPGHGRAQSVVLSFAGDPRRTAVTTTAIVRWGAPL